MLSTLSKQTLKAIGIAAVAIVTGTVFGSHRPAVGDPVGPQVPIVLGFDEVTGMTSISRSPIPDSAKISTNYLSRYGVVFRSTAGYIAVVKLPRRDSISPPNGIGGSSADGKLSYDSKNPISIGFFDKAATDAPAVTDFVSVRCDQDGSDIDVHLVAYDVNGAEIVEDAKKDSDGAYTRLASTR